MVSLLSQILCWIKGAALGVAWAGATVLNWFIAGVGAFGVLVIALLPPMPPGPSGLSADVLAIVNYLFPLGAIVGTLGFFVALWLAIMAIRIPLRWIKAL
jgi:hypothetical protein